jgi:hypothetical protein
LDPDEDCELEHFSGTIHHGLSIEKALLVC